jgi:restriction system protein
LAIPDFQTFMLPVLQASSGGGAINVGQVVQQVSDAFNLNADERATLLPSGKQTVVRNRVAWAKSYLIKAGLLESVGWGQFHITDLGRSILAQAPSKIDNKFLDQFESFRKFRTGNSENPANEAIISIKTPAVSDDVEHTPDEILRAAHAQLEQALAQELIERILAAPPEFFEQLIVLLLVGMGYGGSAPEAGRVLGRSGDDGVDGVVDQDALGLDRVYVQAKRYSTGNNVGAGAIRDFFGSLDRHKATKGLFVTTSTFSSAAQETAEYLSKRIVLIDGRQLARLMIRFNVGCRVEDTLYLKRIDEDFFE